MAEAPETLEGWYALHDFRRLDGARWNALAESERRDAMQEAGEYLRAVQSVDPAQGSSAAYAVIGHKADLMLIHLRPAVEELSALERAFDRLRLANFTTRPYSYLSVTELSLYEAAARGGTEDIARLMEAPFVRKRLYFDIPDVHYACFYPMNKRRGETVNWYAESMEARRAMMREHGSTGAKYRDRITQMITGSVGLDDWEWGVTLFARDPLDVKKLVYAMRFDEVSAKYGEFGPFYFGVRLLPDKMEEFLRSAAKQSD